MIISFTAKNFRSIKDEQTLNLYAENRKDAHIVNVAFPLDDKKFGVLKTAGIYGANASGKSNLVLAMKALHYLVLQSNKWNREQEIECCEPFRLDKECLSQPCFFEAEFIALGNRYIYSVAFTSTEIEHEELKFYPSNQPATLFRREKGDTYETIYLGSHLKGKKRRIPFLKNNLFLSVGGNTDGGPEILMEIYKAFALYVHITPFRVRTNRMIKEDVYRRKVETFLSVADTGIKTMLVEEQDTEQISKELPPELPAEAKQIIIDDHKYKPLFIHQGKENMHFDLREESNGTQKLYYLVGSIIMALEVGGVVVIDELDSSLHPYISEFIIELFNLQETNPHNAQLIFTTHDITLMNPEHMRRDQLWFTDKNENGETELYALDEFKQARSSSPFGKWYSEGRFAAVPKIKFNSFKEILKTIDHAGETRQNG